MDMQALLLNMLHRAVSDLCASLDALRETMRAGTARAMLTADQAAIALLILAPVAGTA